MSNTKLVESSMKIYQDFTLDSNHKLLSLSFQISANISQLSRHPRAIRSLRKLVDPNTNESYVHRFKELSRPLLHLVVELLPLTTLRSATTTSVKRYTPYCTTAVAEPLILEIHCMIFGQTKCKKLMTTENFVSENGERHMDSTGSTTG
jgi:hypothetical protein